jgi:hypothetical protein
VAIAHVIALVWVERRPWADIGLGRTAARGRPLLAGAAVGALAVAVPTGLLLAAGLFQLRPWPAVGDAGAAWLGANAGLLAILAPSALFEELLVRGYAFQVLREGAGDLTAVLATSLVFGLLHLQNPGANALAIGVVVLAGIFLAALRLATGSLWAAFTAHLAWNWVLAGAFHAEVSGAPFPTPGYRMIETGPDWLTGGPWGPEGGAGAAAGLAGALLAIQWRRGRTARPAEQAPAA